jgi:hypothetical protein
MHNEEGSRALRHIAPCGFPPGAAFTGNRARLLLFILHFALCILHFLKERHATE